MKKEIIIKVNDGDKKLNIAALSGSLLTGILKKEGIYFEQPCGGSLRCGKCRVRFLFGAPSPAAHDERFLSAKELQEGIRLLCRCVVKSDCEIVLESTARTGDIEVTKSAGKGSFDGEYLKYAIAVDIGTTTIAASLLGIICEGGEDSFHLIESDGVANGQRRYGADVISRIAAASDKKAADDLRAVLVSDTERLIRKLAGRTGGRQISLVVVTGNTTMLHFFTGKDVSGLGRYPYTPVSTALEDMDPSLVFSKKLCTRLVVMPGISAFVGADIVSGLYSIGILDKKNKALLADLGTNGELAFWDGENIRVTSTAAGPVFEAGNISCGAASIPGAIAHVTIDENEKAMVRTIGKEKPIGICGSGVLETVSEIVRRGIADETGLLKDRYFESGFPLVPDGQISFTQQDIRQVQLAKAAVAAGIAALLCEDIPEEVFISGGLGSHMEIFKVKNVRMFPEAFDDKIISAGNTALAGAEKFAISCLLGCEEDAKEYLLEIVKKSSVIELAALDEFDGDYIASMNF